MRVTVGSINPVKITAVKECIIDYRLFSNAEVSGKGVASGVSSQPISLEETVCGAINRAKNAFAEEYSFGIESGLISVPYTRRGYMDVSCCAIYDGKQISLGLSSAFEVPHVVLSFVLNNGLEGNEALYRAGLTLNPKVGSEEGMTGILTKGRVMRKEQIKEAIRNALILLENEELY